MSEEFTVFGLLDKESQTVSSLVVADKFNKRHADVLRTINKQVLPNISKGFAERNFAFTKKFNKLANRETEFCNLTKDGFMMVAMSLTGKESYFWKEAFVEEFNRLELENQVMKDIVWEVINGQAYLGQEQALKMAGIKHPRLFMKYLKGNSKFYDSVVYDRNLLKHHQCNKHGDRWWKFTKEGFEWLLEGKEKLNSWVEVQKQREKELSKLPC